MSNEVDRYGPVKRAHAAVADLRAQLAAMTAERDAHMVAKANIAADLRSANMELTRLREAKAGEGES